MASAVEELPRWDMERERQRSVAELTEITLAAQRDLFGDAIDPETLWHYEWAGGPHNFLPALWYDNFPYAFGLLFGLGLNARYQADPAGFPERFDALLADTGMADAVELAARFGIDRHAPAFWEAGLGAFRAHVDQFEALVDSRAETAD